MYSLFCNTIIFLTSSSLGILWCTPYIYSANQFRNELSFWFLHADRNAVKQENRGETSETQKKGNDCGSTDSICRQIRNLELFRDKYEFAAPTTACTNWEKSNIQNAWCAADRWAMAGRELSDEREEIGIWLAEHDGN